MRIGIMTFWTSHDNYGQYLQCFALQKKLIELGHDPFLIRYDYRLDYTRNTSIKSKIRKALNPFQLVLYISNKIKEKRIISEQKKHDRHFAEFQKKHIKTSEKIYMSYDELLQSPPKADVYIVGSDQVWNWFDWTGERFENYINGFMLNFGDKNIKRIAYAASWGGREEIEIDQRNFIAERLKQFEAVSVREFSGIICCDKCKREDAFIVPDPTLLISAEQYRNLYNRDDIRKPGYKYVLLYYVENGGHFNIELVFQWAKKRGLVVEYVSGNNTIDKYRKNYAGISEWIYLVDNAQYIITNSYHCSVFSIIFKKRFGVIRITGDHSGMNERFDTLFSEFDTIPRYISNDDFSSLDLPIIDSSYKDYSNQEYIWEKIQI